MKKTVLFEGKVTLANIVVDFRIYKNETDDDTYYSYEINPQVRNSDQADFYMGGITRADTLEHLLFRFSMFQKLFTNIVQQRPNPDF
ncbi:hypothetical protein [Porphyromonas gingivalis]|uniref:hypothetical protein n=1 Tax=Porphyromonas gingivalis TaxID=837 RepID=UPI000C187ACD|nr:hypothetical protein [Porphyromonas gingivalis]ATR92124.1 hypothetical protein CS545_02850 [Porphyromonas gingivalis]ATS08980.1 hypothetical protein CS388_08000 [Porphyromonas gingivalis]